MGVVKSTYKEIWKLEKEIIEAETDIDNYREAIVKAEAELGPLWKKAISSKGDVPLPIQNAMTAINDLINKELPANIAKARKRYDDKKALQKIAGVTLHKYILKKLDSARPGQYPPKKIAFYRRLAEEMRLNFV
jgi:hypothetical protein